MRCSVLGSFLGRPVEFLSFSLLASIGDPINEHVSKGVRGEPSSGRATQEVMHPRHISGKVGLWRGGDAATAMSVRRCSRLLEDVACKQGKFIFEICLA